MPSEPGLRERKKARTHRAISEAAIALFLERGYDAVSVSEIAAAAEVSKRTLFSYFPTKDELVLHRFADHQDEAARVVRGRPPDVTPLDALRDHIRSALGRQDPITGLCDHPAVVAFYRLVSDTPALGAAMARYLTAGEDALTAALHESAPDTPELAARLAAGQILVRAAHPGARQPGAHRRRRNGRRAGPGSGRRGRVGLRPAQLGPRALPLTGPRRIPENRPADRVENGPTAPTFSRPPRHSVERTRP